MLNSTVTFDLSHLNPTPDYVPLDVHIKYSEIMYNTMEDDATVIISNRARDHSDSPSREPEYLPTGVPSPTIETDAMFTNK